MPHARAHRSAHPFVLAAMLVGGLVITQAAQIEWRDAKDWIESLENPNRLAELKPSERLWPLQLKPGEIVADIGAGTGVFSRALARAVGPAGKVYAVDIQQGLLDFINQRSAEEEIDNIQTVFGEFSDPKLPRRDVDVVLFHDVFHAIEHKE